MKNFVRMIAVALLAVMVLSLVACAGSSFGRIKSNFEKNGYVYVENDDGDGIFNSVSASLENGEISCTFHVFKAEEKEDETEAGGILGAIGGALSDLVNAVDYCGVIEFSSDKELAKALEDNATLKGMITDAQKSDLVNGNCVLIPGLINVEEKVEIFTASK